MKLFVLAVESDGPIDFATLFEAAQAMAYRPPAAQETPQRQLPAPVAAAEANGRQHRQTDKRPRRPLSEVREEIAQLLIRGPAKAGEIRDKVRCSNGALYKAMDADWFQRGEKGYELTAAGLAAAQAAASS